MDQYCTDGNNYNHDEIEISAEMFLKRELKEECANEEVQAEIPNNMDFNALDVVKNEINTKIERDDISAASDFNTIDVVKNETNCSIEAKIECDDISAVAGERLQDGAFMNLNVAEFETSQQLKIRKSAMTNHSICHKTLLVRNPSDTCYRCFNCDYSTSRKNIIKRHMKTNTQEGPYHCKNYSSGAASRATFITNARGKHAVDEASNTTDKSFKCSVCDYCSSYSGNLHRHMMSHTGEKPYKCSVCDYSCIQSSNLTTHMKRHTGEKPYKCSICDFTCVTSSHLTTHLKRHTGEKPHKCSICDYSCTQSSNLTRHMRRHTGEKSYKCPICDYSCTQSSNLTTHMKRHLGVH